MEIYLEAHSKKPLTFQWFKKNERIHNGADYKGCTTSKLIFRVSSSNCDGLFKCLVENGDRQTLSEEIEYSKIMH